MNVELIDAMGTDLTVVNAARVSLHKSHSEFTDKDAQLLKYLAYHEHWTPFAHPQISVRVKAPIFVARQLVKHHVGLVWSEVSRRYVYDDIRTYTPKEWRSKAADIKQGSGESLDVLTSDNAMASYQIAIGACKVAYERLLGFGVAPEQARMVLPLSLMTEWIWTGSLYAFFRVWKQRDDNAAQAETGEIAVLLKYVIEPLFPIAWQALEEGV